MKKGISIILSISMIMLLLVSCNSTKKLVKDKMDAKEIDKVQVVLSMGNPSYGADSKIITDSKEITLFVDAFNSAKIGDKIKKEEIPLGFNSDYYFYNGDKIINKFSFNVNDSEKVFVEDDCYKVSYNGKTPFELYESSSAKKIVVDTELNEMTRPD